MLQEAIEKTDANGKLLPEMVSVVPGQRERGICRSCGARTQPSAVKRSLCVRPRHPAHATALVRSFPLADPDLPEPAQQPAAPQRVHSRRDAQVRRLCCPACMSCELPAAKMHFRIHFHFTAACPGLVTPVFHVPHRGASHRTRHRGCGCLRCTSLGVWTRTQSATQCAVPPLHKPAPCRSWHQPNISP